MSMLVVMYCYVNASCNVCYVNASCLLQSIVYPRIVDYDEIFFNECKWTETKIAIKGTEWLE